MLAFQSSIVDKTDLGDKMEGEALTRRMSDDGDMAYTLYTGWLNLDHGKSCRCMETNLCLFHNHSPVLQRLLECILKINRRLPASMCT